MVGWHHRLNGHEFGCSPGIGDGQGGLACCGSWGRKESDTTEWLNWTESFSFGKGNGDGRDRNWQAKPISPPMRGRQEWTHPCGVGSHGPKHPENATLEQAPGTSRDPESLSPFEDMAQGFPNSSAPNGSVMVRDPSSWDFWLSWLHSWLSGRHPHRPPHPPLLPTAPVHSSYDKVWFPTPSCSVNTVCSKFFSTKVTSKCDFHQLGCSWGHPNVGIETSVMPGSATSSWTGSLSEMQMPRAHPRLPGSDSAF